MQRGSWRVARLKAYWIVIDHGFLISLTWKKGDSSWSIDTKISVIYFLSVVLFWCFGLCLTKKNDCFIKSIKLECFLLKPYLILRKSMPKKE